MTFSVMLSPLVLELVGGAGYRRYFLGFFHSELYCASICLNF